MAGVASETSCGLRIAAAEAHYRQLQKARASKVAAARALHANAERALSEIEHRVTLNPGPQGNPHRLPTGGPRLAERFLHASSLYLRVDFAAVIAVVDGVYLGPLLSSEPGRTGSDLHFIYGEGPAIEAATSGTFIEVRDMREWAWRWPAYAPAALEAGWRSGWSIPLPHPDKPGLVLVYAGRDPIPYTVPRFERLARVTRIAQALIVDQPGTVTAQAIRRRIEQAVRLRATTYQASGVLAERLSIGVGPALDLMRMQAWAEKRSLDDISSELLATA